MDDVAPGDIYEQLLVNGRIFDLHIRENKRGDRSSWVAWVKVPGKEHLGKSSASFTGFHEDEVRDKAHAWMMKYRS